MREKSIHQTVKIVLNVQTGQEHKMAIQDVDQMNVEIMQSLKLMGHVNSVRMENYQTL